MLLSEWNGEKQEMPDLARKFNNTYVLSQVKGEKEQVVNIQQVGGVDAQGRHLTVSFVDEKGTMWHRRIDSFDILNALPDPGIYALNDDGIAIVRRIPARQFAEGLYHGNTLIIINGEKHITRNIGFDLAKSLFQKQFDMSLDEGKERLKNGKCIRLNKNYWLKSGTKKSESVAIMRRSSVIGKMSAGAWYYAPGGKMFKEELKDELGFHA